MLASARNEKLFIRKSLPLIVGSEFWSAFDSIRM